MSLDRPHAAGATRMRATPRTAVGTALIAIAVLIGLASVTFFRPSVGFMVLVALGALSAIGIVAAVCRRHPWIYMTAVVAVIVLTPSTGAVPLANVGGIVVIPSDLLAVIGVAGGILGIKSVGYAFRSAKVPAAIFVLMLALQLGRGFQVYGTIAIVEARNILAIVGVALFLASVAQATPLVRLLRQTLYAIGFGLVVVALWNAATRGIGSANYSIQLDTGEMSGSRVITSSQAAAVAVALLLALRDWVVRREARYGLAAAAFAIVILIAQHRSVWFAAGAAVVFYLLIERRRSRVTLALLITAWACALVVPLIIWSGTDLFAVVSDSLSTASLTEGTGGGRVESNNVLLAMFFADPNPLTIAFGYPFGYGWSRVVMGRVVEYSPHMVYIEVLHRVGAVGLAALVALLLAALIPAWHRGATAETASVLFLVIFSTAYGLPLISALVVMLALAAQRSDEAVLPPRPASSSASAAASARRFYAGQR